MRLLLLAATGLVLVAGSARAAAPPVLGFSVSSGPGTPAPVSLPSAGMPNAPGSIAVPVAFTSPPPDPQQLPVSALNALWQRAGASYGIPWQVLASINKIESNFGQNMGPSSAGAVGWMQFMPSTWLRWGVDADANGIADPWNATDAIFAAARYLAAAGGQTDIARGVFAYNHADWYVREVLDLAQVYGQGGITQTVDLQQVQAKLDAARRAVVDANERLQTARQRVQQLAPTSQQLHAQVDAASLLSDRLAAERKAVLYDVSVDAARREVAASQAALEQARKSLATATQSAQAPSFAPGVGTLMAAASYHDGYVFPVGGGPQLVSVAHTHHDYPAADIAAPAGSPVYAIANAVVLNAWHSADPRCGIGLTIRTQDGLVWTYCHLAFLEPAVADGVSLAAGTQIGLVGSTGHATGPHLHLQLQPATEFPRTRRGSRASPGAPSRGRTPRRRSSCPTPLPSRRVSSRSSLSRVMP